MEQEKNLWNLLICLEHFKMFYESFSKVYIGQEAEIDALYGLFIVGIHYI